MQKIIAKALTPEAFAPYGDVIDTSTAANSFEINYGNTTRFHDLATIDVEDEGGQAGFSIFRAKPVSLPHQAKVMEYHPLGSQLFYPLCDSPFLILVAPPAKKLDIDQLELFLSNGKQGVNYHKGVWHHYLLPLDKVSEFVVLDRIADDKNCVEAEINTEVLISA